MTGAELIQKIEDAIAVNGPLFRGATVWHRWEEIKEALIAGDAARDDARDAARYRWLRERTAHAGLSRFIRLSGHQLLDAAIDAAMGGNDA